MFIPKPFEPPVNIYGTIILVTMFVLGIRGFAPTWIVWMSLAFLPANFSEKYDLPALLIHVWNKGANQFTVMLVAAMILNLITLCILYYLGYGIRLLFLYITV